MCQRTVAVLLQLLDRPGFLGIEPLRYDFLSHLSLSSGASLCPTSPCTISIDHHQPPGSVLKRHALLNSLSVRTGTMPTFSRNIPEEKDVDVEFTTLDLLSVGERRAESSPSRSPESPRVRSPFDAPREEGRSAHEGSRPAGSTRAEVPAARQTLAARTKAHRS